jgi:hypothetical protein
MKAQIWPAICPKNFVAVGSERPSPSGDSDFDPKRILDSVDRDWISRFRIDDGVIQRAKSDMNFSAENRLDFHRFNEWMYRTQPIYLISLRTQANSSIIFCLTYEKEISIPLP